MPDDESFKCRSCDRVCDSTYEYDMEMESGVYPVTWYRCPGCGEEYLHARELLLPELGEAGGAGVGEYRRVSLCHAMSPERIEEPGGRSVAPLVATALEGEFVDAVLLPDYGRDRRMHVVTDPDEATGLRRSWATLARGIPVNAGLVANLDFLIEMEQFAREDGGAHPRVAVVGRPCHIYSARRANFDRIAPGYRLDLTMGQFCYGNISPSSSPALRFERLTGLPPSQIRGMSVADGKVRVTGGERSAVEVPLQEFASFLHKSCLKCVDFTVPWADLSVGEDPRIPGFDVVLVRSDRGEALLSAALGGGRLRAWSPPWIEGGGESVRILSDLTAIKRDLAQVSR